MNETVSTSIYDPDYLIGKQRKLSR